MDIIVQSLGFTAGENLELFVREKISKLEDFGARIIRANVTLFMGSRRNPENNYCEVRLEVPGSDVFVKKSNATFETAIVEAADALQLILIKEKEKRIDSRRRT